MNYPYTTKIVPPNELTVYHGPSKPPFRDLLEGNKNAQAWYSAMDEWRQQMEGGGTPPLRMPNPKEGEKSNHES